MTSILISNLSFSHTDSVPLIVDLSLRIDAGWIGVVGANGSGKTTLLELLAGEREPDSGEIRRHPPDLRCRLCPQTVDRCTPEVVRLSRESRGEAQRIRGELGLSTHELEHWDALSPGERKRWQVGAAIFDQPDALILDEPTNHLDADARARLIAALRGFRGLGIAVSHDRTLLDTLTTQTLRFDRGEVRCWRGCYSSARSSWKRDEDEELDAYRRLQAEKGKLRRRLADTRRNRAGAESRMRTSKRMKSAQDSDARGRYKAKRRRSAEASLGREVQKLRGKLERLAERREGFDLHKALGRSLSVNWVPASLPRLMSLDLDELRAGEEILLRGVHVQVSRESRIHIAGANGAGKTTLVERLLEQRRVPASRLLYLPQELGPARETALLKELRASSPEEQGRVLSIVAALGVDPGGLLASVRPSPGEARKLVMAFGLARQVWALVLDEPTNHLDLPSIERIEAALSAYPGALLVVTHDDAFARGCTDTVWDLRDARVLVRSAEVTRPPVGR